MDALDKDFLQHIESTDLPCLSCGARWEVYTTVPSPVDGMPVDLHQIDHADNCLYIELQKD